MWQRIQTLFIFIAILLTAILFFSDAAVIIGEGGTAAGIPYREKLPYLVLMSLGGLAEVVALFSFKKRMFQLRMTAVAFVLMLGLQGWLVYDYFTAPDGMVFKFTAIFPLVAAVLDILAIRGIFADELMVRSSKRLRAAKNKKL